MKSQINLLIEKGVVTKEVKKYFITSIIIFAASVLITGIVLLYRFILTQQYNGLLDNEQKLRASIQQQDEKRLNYLLLQQRLTSVNNVMNNREKIAAYLGEIMDLATSSITIQTIEIEAGKATVSLDSPDLAAINVFLDKLFELDEKTTDIVKADLQSFSHSNEANTYSLSLDVIFAEQKATQ